jgi:hypothetical protein
MYPDIAKPLRSTNCVESHHVAKCKETYTAAITRTGMERSQTDMAMDFLSSKPHI